MRDSQTTKESHIKEIQTTRGSYIKEIQTMRDDERTSHQGQAGNVR